MVIASSLMLVAVAAEHRALANHGVVPPPLEAPAPAAPQTAPPGARTPGAIETGSGKKSGAADVAQEDDEEGEDEESEEALPARRPPPADPRVMPPRRIYARGPRHISGNMLGLRFGFAVGGTTLLRAQLSNGSERTITAGGGGALAVAGAITPYWTETFGMGLGVEFGWKGQEISATNATISMDRFPLVVTAHILAQVGERSYLMILAGVQRDFAISQSASGAVSAADYTLESRLGFLAGLGYHYALGQNFTLDGLLRFTKLDYEAQMGGATETVDAKHVAFLLGANYHFDSDPDATP